MDRACDVSLARACGPYEKHCVTTCASCLDGAPNAVGALALTDEGLERVHLSRGIEERPELTAVRDGVLYTEELRREATPLRISQEHDLHAPHRSSAAA